MWEIIASNQRKSALLIGAMGALLLGFGWVIGELVAGPNVGGGVLGCGVAGGVWILMTAVSYFKGDAILLKSSGAHEVTPELHPELFNVVEEMKIAANLPALPKVYIIDDPGMNAFAAGTRKEKSCIAVTAGLLTTLDRDELQGVVAHETGHILNRDVLYMTLAGVMLGSLQMLSQMFLRGMLHSGGSGRRYRSSRSNSKGGQGILILAAVVLAILGPILAQIFYFSLSRKREYLADATGARLTRYPEGLASALEKISGRSALAASNPAAEPMFIEHPSARSAAGSGVNALFTTHPPIEKRVAILRSMTSAGYAGYSAAARAVLGGATVPAAALKEADASIRAAAVSRPVGLGRFTPMSEARQTSDLIRAVNGFIFFNCGCGLRLKLPPEFAHPIVTCPKCARSIEVPGRQQPAATAAAPAAPGAAAMPAAPPGWRTIACRSCAKALTLSPAFDAPYAICRFCGQKNSV